MEEMSRLLKDAQKISGVKYDISNLSDVYSAIHVIQDNLGVTGTTAKEASTTFSGSFASMKSSLKNLLANMSLGGDIEGSMAELISTASTFLVNNAIPMVVNVIKVLPKAIKTGIALAKPQLMEAGSSLFGESFSKITTVFDKIKTVISNLITAIQPVIATYIEIFKQVIEKVKAVIGVVQSHMGTFKAIFEAVIPAVSALISTAWNIISPIIDLGITLFNGFMKCVAVVFPVIQRVIEGVWKVLEPIFNGIGKGIGLIGDALSGVGGFIGKGINTVAGWFGFAYGKDRVPYDNYPAMLHAGERVLTRNQADQYDRVMSTRGVTSIGKVQAPTGATTSAGGTNVSIEKLADTVVLEKDADVDKVVEGMIAKFRKLVPNMA